MIAAGHDVNSRNHFEKTPLMYAAQFNLLETAEILIEAGADLEARIVESASIRCGLTVGLLAPRNKAWAFIEDITTHQFVLCLSTPYGKYAQKTNKTLGIAEVLRAPCKATVSRLRNDPVTGQMQAWN